MTIEEGLMSSMSRRSLLGYSGTAAAGAVPASGGPAEAAAADATRTSDAAAVSFANGTEFSGMAKIASDDMGPEIHLTFSVSVSETPAANTVTPLEIANALNELAATRDWPAITFYGTPVPAPLS